MFDVSFYKTSTYSEEKQIFRNDLFTQKLTHWAVIMPWPRAPISDLKPCDFFMWGFIKSNVYLTRPTDIPELKQRIRVALSEITDKMRQNVIREGFLVDMWKSTVNNAF